MRYSRTDYILTFPSDIQAGIRRSLYRCFAGNPVYVMLTDGKVIQTDNFNRLSAKNKKAVIDDACTNRICNLADTYGFNPQYWVDKANAKR